VLLPLAIPPVSPTTFTHAVYHDRRGVAPPRLISFSDRPIPWYPLRVRGWLELAAAVAAALAGSASAAPADWVGNDKCGGNCHAAEAAAWAAGPHARATASLEANRRRQRCLGCHATGEAPAGKALFDGVGCESCHGPGAGYAIDDVMRDPPLSAALGLVDLGTAAGRQAVCRRCHQPELGRPKFDAEAGWARLPHSKKLPGPTGAAP
jgi:hypothetical protein